MSEIMLAHLSLADYAALVRAHEEVREIPAIDAEAYAPTVVPPSSVEAPRDTIRTPAAYVVEAA